MIKKAVIDIGTNSVRLLIAGLEKGNIKVIDKKVLSTRLGEGVNSNGRLQKDPIRRTLDAIKLLIQDAIDSDVKDIFCFATSAVRDAQNREFFIQEVNRHCGIDVKVLSGDQEARAGFAGALIDSPYRDDEVVLLDIGGGSTELVRGNENNIQDALSLDIGAVRLTEMFPLDHPINYENWNSMSCYVRDMLKYECKIQSVNLPLIGVGGTITSLAAMDQELKVYRAEKIQGYCLKREAIEGLLQKLFSCSPDERKKLPGLQPSRADIILAGICILIRVMKYFSAGKIIVSDFDNLEGVLFLSNTRLL